MSRRRVAVTGIGMISALGRNSAEVRKALSDGAFGIGPIQSADCSKLRFQNGAEVRGYRPEEHFEPARLDLLDRFSQFALIAAREALCTSGLQLTPDLRAKTAVVTGSSMGGQSTQDSGFLDLYRLDRSRVHPLTIPRTMTSAATSHISMEFG